MVLKLSLAKGAAHVYRACAIVDCLRVYVFTIDHYLVLRNFFSHGLFIESYKIGCWSIFPMPSGSNAAMCKFSELSPTVVIRIGEPQRHLRREPEEPRGFLGRPGSKQAAVDERI